MHLDTTTIPLGLCQCGCGQTTPLARRTKTGIGHVKGLPIPCVLGHTRSRRWNPDNPPNPSGLCLCGCGERTPIARVTRNHLGHVRGQPTRYAIGHANKGNRIPAAERFWHYCERRDPADCWPWLGSKNRKGYGIFTDVPGHTIAAYRFAYELAYGSGSIPAGLVLDHLCRNPSCCNPAHLEPVTDRINILRGEAPAAKQARQTHCKRGHPLSGDNLYRNPKGARVCRTCIRDAGREYMRAKRAHQRQVQAS